MKTPPRLIFFALLHPLPPISKKETCSIKLPLYIKAEFKARLCRQARAPADACQQVAASAFHSYTCRTRGCSSAFKGPPPPQRPRRVLQILSGAARLTSLAQLRLLLIKRASEKIKKLKVSVDRPHALKHFGHDPPPSSSLLILGACLTLPRGPFDACRWVKVVSKA